MTLPPDERTGNLPREVLEAVIPGVPTEVLDQLFVLHGRNLDMQRAYGDLRLDTLTWRLTSLPAYELSEASVLPAFAAYVEQTEKRVAAALAGDDSPNIHPSRAVSASWLERGTWLTPPVLLMGSLVNDRADYRLWEGHTRLGTLRAMLARNLISGTSSHSVWLASPDSRSS
jgi:hypothetical protein